MEMHVRELKIDDEEVVFFFAPMLHTLLIKYDNFHALFDWMYFFFHSFFSGALAIVVLLHNSEKEKKKKIE